MMIIIMSLVTLALIALGVAHFMAKYRKVATIVMDSTLAFACESFLNFKSHLQA